jgi:hypothetical protein
MGLTVSELAERVRRPEEDLSALIARLRNWTKEGLLTPEGDPHPGIGRSRLYPETAVADARALAMLADIIGIPAVKSKSFDQFFQEARKAFTRPTAAHLYFVIAKSLNGEAREIWTGKREFLDKELKRSKFPVHLVIDLKVYFEQMGAVDG